MNHKVISVNISHGFQSRYWEKGESTSVEENELRKDEEGNLIPPPHFKFADGTSKKKPSEKAEKKPSEKAAK